MKQCTPFYIELHLKEMFNFGILLIIMGSVFILGSLDGLAKGEKTLIFPASLMLAGGSFITKKGLNHKNLTKVCAEMALKQNRENGFIAADQLGKELQIPEIYIRKLLAKAKEECYIPEDIIIK